MTNYQLFDRMTEYIETCSDVEEETYCSYKRHAIDELEGFLDFLREKGYQFPQKLEDCLDK